MGEVSEPTVAVAIAKCVLDEPGRDPDGDMAILARQLLRSREEFYRVKEAIFAAAYERAAQIAECYRCSPQPEWSLITRSRIERQNKVAQAIADRIRTEACEATRGQKPDSTS